MAFHFGGGDSEEITVACYCIAFAGCVSPNGFVEALGTENSTRRLAVGNNGEWRAGRD